MDNLQNAVTPAAAASRGWSPLALGFRPFFLLSALSGVILIALWPAMWRGVLSPPAYYDALVWHSHEMLFGYAAAVIAGFLLTAVRNWTGNDTPNGWRLGLLAVLWLMGRLLPWLEGMPVVVVIGVDVAFLAFVALSLAPALWQANARVNRLFVPLLLAMSLANLLSHLQFAGFAAQFGDGRRVMLGLVLLLIVVVAGRVLPFFTRNVLPGFVPITRPAVEKLSVTLAILIVLRELLGNLPAGLSASLWLLFAVTQLVRIAGWFDRRIFSLPILWILHVGYAWLAVASFLTGLSELALFPVNLALHALTIGTVGVFTLGMMTRVARGHTGRAINVSRATALAFVALNAGAVVRVFAPAILPDSYRFWVDLSAALWVLAFLIFTVRYTPLLLRTRVDGKPG